MDLFEFFLLWIYWAFWTQGLTVLSVLEGSQPLFLLTLPLPRSLFLIELLTLYSLSLNLLSWSPFLVLRWIISSGLYSGWIASPDLFLTMDSLIQYVLTLIIFSSRNSIWFFSKSVWPFLFLAHVPCLPFSKHDWFIVQDCSFQKKRDSSFGQKHLYLTKGTHITCLIRQLCFQGQPRKWCHFLWQHFCHPASSG